MQREKRLVYYDPDLGVEAYYFKGIVQKFPDHFHEHYVIGAIESGERFALCGGERHLVRPGDLVVFCPGVVHACQQVGGYPLDWRCLNVPAPVMERAVAEVTGRGYLPSLSRVVLCRSELAGLLREVWAMAAGERRDLRKEEAFLLLIGQLLEECGGYEPPPDVGARPEVEAVCAHLEARCGQPVSLDELAAVAGLSKGYLLRAFAREKGITPYRYLENLRIERAKRLLEEGVRPVDAALQTGFSDQSHFTNHFKTLIGLTPSQYRAVFAGEGKERASHG